MEKEEDDAPLAVELEETVPVQPSSYHAKQLQGEDVSVGVTVITGYLGSGKSTVKSHHNLDKLISLMMIDKMLRLSGIYISICLLIRLFFQKKMGVGNQMLFCQIFWAPIFIEIKGLMFFQLTTGFYIVL